ncbi:class A beta-lactamase [Amnibacterium setariae]|uniref:Beta-lactamase n=1 Tax=Amnibacterium setariae TaxID=2306585 RepID=A0A3A1U386_9MICO|nr:class A beta-lactamase [Amnibacterium setariae]
MAGCSSGSATSSPSAPPSTASPSSSDAAAEQALQRELDDLEARYGARLGVTAIDTGTGRRLTHRADERFAFASTNKAFIAAATLRSASAADLDAVVRYARSDLLASAPITSRHVDTGMTVRALLDAAVRYSDNTAANLLVRRLGGTAAVERFLRSIGDRTTSVDRLEPDLNTATPGDERDTTTPAASARDVEAVLLGSALPRERRAVLDDLMTRSSTGGLYIRAGVPAGWAIADKTGSGAHGTRNDIAVLRPPGRAPIVLVLLSRRVAEDAASDDALLADATAAVVRALDRA